MKVWLNGATRNTSQSMHIVFLLFAWEFLTASPVCLRSSTIRKYQTQYRPVPLRAVVSSEGDNIDREPSVNNKNEERPRELCFYTLEPLERSCLFAATAIVVPNKKLSGGKGDETIQIQHNKRWMEVPFVLSAESTCCTHQHSEHFTTQLSSRTVGTKAGSPHDVLA